MKKVVLIRLDKIGDLISTIPVDQAPFLSGSDITWVISKGLSFVPENADPKRKFIELDKNDPWPSFSKLVQFLRNEKPDVAVSFQAPWWVSLALLVAGVPVRAGVQSQWHSFLFLNKALRQKRSEARQHEADYNADLLAFAFDELDKRILSQRHTQGVQYLSPLLHMTAPEKIDLSRFGLQSHQYVIVHPGMAGSALNWPIAKYITLIAELIKDTKVVLTGTAADEKWLTEIKKTYVGNPQVINLQDQLNSKELLSVISEAKAVVCPSTGVAHIAAALGTPLVAMYSPIRVQHPRRWAARGNDVEILLPDSPCQAAFNCEGESCKYFFCMDKISVDSVLQKVKEIQN
jgi:ADP-heptose:LPS heptosyltransferase